MPVRHKREGSRKRGKKTPAKRAIFHSLSSETIQTFKKSDKRQRGNFEASPWRVNILFDVFEGIPTQCSSPAVRRIQISRSSPWAESLRRFLFNFPQNLCKILCENIFAVRLQHWSAPYRDLCETMYEFCKTISLIVHLCRYLTKVSKEAT